MGVPIELVRQRDALKQLLKVAPQKISDVEMLGHWGRYTCVLVAGFLENSLRLQFAEFANKRAQPKVATYVAGALNKIQNPKGSRFLEIAGQFDKDLGERLRSHLDESDGRRKQAIDSIMANRHLIAHGRPCAVSVHRVLEWFECSCEVVDFLSQELAL